MIKRSFVLILPILLASCGSKTEPKAVEVPTPASKPAGTVVQIKAPLGLPPLDLPADNPPTAETIALGRKLYYDAKLSGDNSVSCATCHNPGFGFTDGKPVSTGVGGKKGGRSAPSVINAAYYAVQFWDGRARSLEEQAAGPIANPIEMNLPHTVCIEKLNADPEYKAEFARAFGPDPVNIEMVKKAIASFERTVLSGNSPFDKYQYGGNKKAMSPAAIRGLALFKDVNKGNCAVCHTIEEKHALFSDSKFHNLGVGINAKGELTDLGRYDATKVDADKGAFKTPTLRDIAKTGPYMHDGSLKTLKDVVDFYVGGGNSNPNLDKEIKSLKLNQKERADLVAFLEALTGELPADIGPPAS
jgi:cytochrome c peroxidase